MINTDLPVSEMLAGVKLVRLSTNYIRAQVGLFRGREYEDVFSILSSFQCPCCVAPP